MNNNALYSGSIPVTSQSQAQRMSALPEALSQVLVKVSGNSAVTTIPRIKDNLSKANSMLISYRYEKNTNTEDTIHPYLLVANFNAGNVDRLLKNSHQAIWGNDRPLLLFWIATQNVSQSQLISNDDNPDLYRAISHSATQRGLPVTFPLFDLTDLSDISAKDIIKNNEKNIIIASQRYPHMGIVTIVLSQDADNIWQSKAVLEQNGQQQQFMTSGNTQNEAVTSTLNQIADELASNYAVLHTGQERGHQYTITVYGIKSLDTFAEVSQYLKQLSLVQAVMINEISPDSAIFSVTISGDQNALMQAISLDNQLLPYQSAGTTVDSNKLVYKVRA